MSRTWLVDPLDDRIRRGAGVGLAWLFSEMSHRFHLSASLFLSPFFVGAGSVRQKEGRNIDQFQPQYLPDMRTLLCELVRAFADLHRLHLKH